MTGKMVFDLQKHVNGYVLKNCSISSRKTAGARQPQIMVHQHFKMFSVTCSHFFGIWELVEPWKNELWSCYRPVHTPQPLSTMTSSEANAASLWTLFARRDNPHTTCSNYWGYMRNEVANNDFFACLTMPKSTRLLRAISISVKV